MIRRFTLSTLAVVLLSTAAFGQSGNWSKSIGQTFDAGVKVGVPATAFFDTGSSGSLHGSALYSSATKRYTFGFSAELHLTNGFGFELDAMYHRLGYNGNISTFDSANGNFTNTTFHGTGNAWDFPLLAKYRFGKVVRPFVSGGGTLRYIGPAHAEGQVMTGTIFPPTSSTSDFTNDSPSDLSKRVYTGVTIGGGVELTFGRFKILPEVRYTRWTSNIAGENGVLRFSPNQVEILAGLNF